MSTKIYKINSNLAKYTDEEFSAIETLLATEGVFDISGTDQDFEVTESSPAAMTVDVAVGTALVEYLKSSITWKVVVNSNAVETLSVSANSSGNNRVDAVVIHLKQDEPNALKNNVAELKVMLGDGVASLSDADLNTALGDTNWYRLADITVPDGTLDIENGDITDTRERVTLDALPTDGATNYVELTGNQTVAGIKTFSSFPVTPSAAPTTNYQVPNKKYVDDEIVLAEPGVNLITAGESINGSVTPKAAFISRGVNASDAFPMQVQETENNAGTNAWGVNFQGQTITTGAYQDVLTRVDLLLLKVLAPSGNMQVDIYAVDGAHKPTGASLGTKTLVASTPSAAYLDWITFTFASAITVTPATEYAAVLRVVSGDAANHIVWSVGNGDTYADGLPVSSGDAGATWGTATNDHSFRCWGYEDQTEGELYMSDKDEAFRGLVDGFVSSNTTVGNTATFRSGGTQDSFVGLTIGSFYYVDSTIGGVTSSSGGLKAGLAISATEIKIDFRGGFVQQAVTNSPTFGYNTSSAIKYQAAHQYGFKPSRITFQVRLTVYDGGTTKVQIYNVDYISAFSGVLIVSAGASSIFSSNTLVVTQGGVTVTLNAVSMTDTGMTCNVVLGFVGGTDTGSASIQAIAYR